MFSATTTGPETEKIEPCSCSSFEAIVEVDCVEGEDMEVVEIDEAGESGSGGSSGGDGDGGRESSSRLRINPSNDGRALSCGLPNPNMNHMGTSKSRGACHGGSTSFGLSWDPPEAVIQSSCTPPISLAQIRSPKKKKNAQRAERGYCYSVRNWKSLDDHPWICSWADRIGL